MSRSTPAVVVAVLLVVLAGVAPAGVGVLGSAPVGTAQAAPGGFVGVPSENVDEDVIATYDGALSAASLDGAVMASSNASTLEVLVVSSEMAPKYQNSQVHGGNVITEGDVGLVLRDDVNHAGRDVALPVDVIREQFGYVPEQVRGAHENGSRWTSPTRVEDGSLIFNVPHFSTQTVAFESEVRLTGSQATDQTQWLYNVSKAESVENVSTTLTGIEATERETVSKAAVADGGTLALDVAGTDPATNASLTFTGDGFDRWDNTTATGAGLSSSQALGVDGNLQPVAGDGGDPKLTVTASAPENLYNPFYDEGDGEYNAPVAIAGDHADDTVVKTEVRVDPNYDGRIAEIRPDITSIFESGYGPTVDVYFVAEAPDGTYGEGTQVATWTPADTTTRQTITFDSPVDVSSGQTYTIEFVTRSSNGDGTDNEYRMGTDNSASTTWIWSTDLGGSGSYYGDMEIYENQTVDALSVSDGDGHSASFGTMSNGETVTKRLDVKPSSTSLNWSGSGGGSIDYSLEMRERAGSEDPAFDTDSDGINDVSHTGVLMEGETATYALSDLAVGSGPSTIGTTSGTVDVAVDYTEHTVTENVDVLVNGNATSHAGTLGAGNTTTLAHPDSDVKAGENNVTVRVAPGLSADAPAAKVGMNYSHDASRTFSATRSDSKWEESYNVSQTLASNRSHVTADLPFTSQVVEFESVETRTNGGAWSAVSSSSYQFDGTDLTVDTGSATEGDTVEVRATGRRVLVENGSITVEDPTVEGDKLSTLFEVTSKSSGFHIRTENTSDGKLHYISSKSWTGEPYAVVAAGSPQQIHMPGASVGSTARIKTLPMQVEPEAGAMEVVVEDASQPQFRLRTGGTSGADDVRIVYNDTVSGETYRLWSVTQEREVMADTAESPVYFSTDGDDETYLIEVKDGSGGTQAVIAVGGGDGGGPLPVLALFLGVAGSIVGVFLLGRKLGVSGRRWNALLVGVGAIVGLVGVELATARSVVSDVLFALGDVVGAAASTGAGAVVIGVVVLLALYGFHSRIWGLPLWMRILTFGAVVLWIVDELSGGAFTATLGELGPLLWLIMALGGIALLWRALQGPTFNVVGVRK